VTRYVLRTERGEVRLQVAQASHVGMVRAVNEDSLLAEPPVFAVADGMGGHSFGDRASATAVLALHEEFDPGQATEPDHVLAAIRRANAAVRELTAWAGGGTHLIAGTTLAGVALVVEHPDAEPRWMVFNLGDSRVYRVRGDAGGVVAGVERVTVDHSLVQELLDAGLIDDDEARTHPERNVITRALGAADEVRAETWMLPATEPQTFLLCSDGLTKELDDARIAALLTTFGHADTDSPDAAVDRLLAAALAAGGADNVSIVVLRAEYHETASNDGEPDEQTRERGLSALSPELDDTRPRV
jgi:serine/threonine protein phosphatase PrpC